MYETVLSTLDAKGVRTITLNRPKQLNAMNRQLLRDLAAAFVAANEDEATKVIIFTGAGRAFCAGDDLDEHVHPENEAAARNHVAHHPARHRSHSLRRQAGDRRDQWLGGGRRLRMGDQLRFPHLGGKCARLLSRSSNGGCSSPAASARCCRRLAGLQNAREMMFLGERYDAKTLLEKGVAWRVVPDAESDGGGAD